MGKYDAIAESNRRRAKHGQSGGENKPSKAYVSWRAMKTRCLNPKCKAYPQYGGRGITICKEWIDDFATFYADLGEPPPRAWLERIDNDKGYVRGNVRWATPKEQGNNRRTNTWVEHEGKRMTLAEWARHLDVPYRLLMNRWVKGKRGDELLAPRQNRKHNEPVEYNGVSMTLREWARVTGVSYSKLWYRFSNNLPLFK